MLSHLLANPFEVLLRGEKLLDMISVEDMISKMKEGGDVTITIDAPDPGTGTRMTRTFNGVKAFVIGMLDSTGNLVGWRYGYGDALFLLSRDLYYRSVLGVHDHEQDQD